MKCSYEIDYPDDELRRRRQELEFIEDFSKEPVKTSQNGLNKQNKVSEKEQEGQK